MSEQRPRPPSVERVLHQVALRLDGRDHEAVLREARTVLDAERERLREAAAPPGPAAPPAAVDELADRVVARLRQLADPRSSAPPRVINATGVLLHTNLGRAPWPEVAIQAAAMAGGATLLELDPESGRRGRRFRVAEEHVIALTGAEDALMTNNNAAAVALAVGHAGRGGVAVSRGELVEIGGGVRIPEIVRRAGARLVEVGTTNRTRVEDFEEVLGDGRAQLVLRVHPSNFTQLGFVEGPDPKALAEVAHARGAIVVDDLGSGALVDTARFGLAHEPMPGERLADGADLVTFSGDKLVGGPQAGIVAGRADLVARLRRDPLARAMRPDKVMLAAIGATLGLYRAGTALSEIPIWRQIAASRESLAARAREIAERLPRGVGEPVECESTIGGGSLPGQTLPSWGLAIAGPAPDRLLARLRHATTPVIGRIASDAVLLDLRTVEPADDEALATAIARSMPGAARAR